jgi:hypothetical protein
MSLAVKVSFCQESWYPLLKVGHTYNETGVAKVIRVNGQVHLQPRFVAGVDWCLLDLLRTDALPKLINWATVFAWRNGFLVTPGKLVSNSGCHRTELRWLLTEGYHARLWKIRHVIEAPRQDRNALLAFLDAFCGGASAVIDYVAAGPDRALILEEAGIANPAATIYVDNKDVEDCADLGILCGRTLCLPVEVVAENEEHRPYTQSPHSFFGTQFKASAWYRWKTPSASYALGHLGENQTVTAPDGDTVDLGAGWWLFVHQ